MDVVLETGVIATYKRLSWNSSEPGRGTLPASTRRMLRDKCCSETLSRRRANDSMASAAFFFISKRFNEINVGRCLDKLVSKVANGVEPDLRYDLNDIRGRKVDGGLIRLDVDTRINDLECGRYGTEMSRRNSCGELGVGDERVSLSYKDAHVKTVIPTAPTQKKNTYVSSPPRANPSDTGRAF